MALRVADKYQLADDGLHRQASGQELILLQNKSLDLEAQLTWTKMPSKQENSSDDSASSKA